MKLVEFSTRRRVTVAMLMVAIVAFGGVGFSRLSVNLLPDITYPTITVRTEYEGVAPVEIERLISEPVEGLVGVVSNVNRVSSISRPGVSDVVVEFGAGGRLRDFFIVSRHRVLRLHSSRFTPQHARFELTFAPALALACFGLFATSPPSTSGAAGLLFCPCAAVHARRHAHPLHHARGAMMTPNTSD